jgi:serine/threonine protein kinase
MLTPGALLGPYRIVASIGKGGMGEVYRATDTRMGRDVAIKVVAEQFLERFNHEVRAIAALNHPNICTIHDVGRAYLVMEYVDGVPLKGPLPEEAAMKLALQIAAALEAAHARGIVHCDLKPANLMFRRDVDVAGVEVMLGDFGVAHLPDASGVVASAERRAEAVGTLAYMAPEQRRGSVTAASDVFASAVVLFEMLVGRTPWPRETVLAGTRRREDFAVPESVFAIAPAIAQDVQSHLASLGDPDPRKRPTTAQALAEAQRLREHAIAAGVP